jgi:hypothetical protein
MQDINIANYGYTPIHASGALNPGLINAPDFYNTNDPAQSKYYWGSHPYQPGSTFDSTLYNQVPNAPVKPWGVGHAQTAATANDVLNAMQGRYPLLGTTSQQPMPTIGPVIPTIVP